MKALDVLRREAAGLRRSIRYDLVRRAELQRERAGNRPTEVLSDGGPRRALTVAGVSLVLAGGAAGTYLAVAGGLGLFGVDDAGAAALTPVGPAVVLPAGTPVPDHPFVAPAPRPVPRPAKPARPGGAAAAVVVPPQVADAPSVPATSTPPSPDPESTTTTSPGPSASPSASPTPSPTPDQGRPPAGP